MRPHIFGLELRECGQVLIGDADILSLIPDFPARELPLEDGWHLLMNRLIELLLPAAESVERGCGQMPPELAYRTAKLYLDMASSLLVFTGEFVPGYRKRRERLYGMAGRVDDLPFAPDDFANRVGEATSFKLEGASGDGMRDWAQLVTALSYAHELWRWELMRLTGSRGHECDAALIRRWALSQPLSRQLRGWASQLRNGALRSELFRAPGRFVAAWPVAPRLQVYAAAADLAFALPSLLESKASGDARDWQEVIRRMPIQITPPSSAGSLTDYARTILRNYEELLVGTRT